MDTYRSFFLDEYKNREQWNSVVKRIRELSDSVGTNETIMQPITTHEKLPVILMGSVKGGSSKTYNTLSLAVALTHYFMNPTSEGMSEELEDRAPVCVIDLDLSATNMRTILDKANTYLNANESFVFEYEKDKFSVHRFIIESALKAPRILDATTTVKYMVSNSWYKLDVVLGTSDSKIRGLFSEGLVGAYENGIRTDDARIALMNLLDAVLKRGYKAIVIDLQPGMEGLCRAAIEYFAQRGSPEYSGDGPKSKELQKVYKQYEAHLCLCCTNDMTQMDCNLEWVLKHWSLCRRIKNRHILIKDNTTELESKFNLNGDSSDKEDDIFDNWKKLIKVGIESSLYVHVENISSIESYFKTILLLKNNKKYMDMISDTALLWGSFDSQRRSFEEIMMNEQGSESEIRYWMLRALLHRKLQE